MNFFTHILFLLLLITSLLPGEQLGYEEPEKQLSRWLGYHLCKDLHELGLDAIDGQSFLEGVEKYKQGEHLAANSWDEELNKARSVRMLLKVRERKELSASFIADLKLQKQIKELKPDLLYYKQVEEGTGKDLQEHAVGSFFLKCSLLGEEEPFIDTYAAKKSIKQELDTAIPGFERGVIGMKENERRILYIAPELGYGTKTISDYQQQSLLIIDVTLLEVLS